MPSPVPHQNANKDLQNTWVLSNLIGVKHSRRVSLDMHEDGATPTTHTAI